MSFNRNQLNPNVWDIRGGSNQQPFNGGQQSLPSLFSPTNFHQQQPNQFMNHGNNFQNNLNNSYHQPIGSMFNSNEPSFNNNQYRKFNQSRPNRPGPAFSKRNAVWESDVSVGGNYDNFSRDTREFDSRQSKSNSSHSEASSGLKSTLERLKKKPANADPIEVSNKLLTKLKTMPKSDVKDLINNPKQQFNKTVLNIQAKQNIREQNRQKLRTLGNEGDCGELEVDEVIDSQQLPGFLNELTKGDADENMDVVQKNLGTDFLQGSEMLLMTGFSLLGDGDEQPQFEVPEVPPLPSDKEKPPLPCDKTAVVSPKPIPPPESRISPTDKHFISFYNNSPRDWEKDVDLPKNPDPPSSEKQQKKLDEHVNVRIEVCEYATGLRPMYSSKDPPKPKDIPDSVAAEYDNIIDKIMAPSPTSRAKTPRMVSPVCSGTPKSVTSNSSQKVFKPQESSKKSTEKSAQPAVETPQADKPESQTEKPADGGGRRANETYGDYRRRLDAEQKKHDDERRETHNESNQDISPPEKRQKGPQTPQNPPRDRNWKGNNRWGWNDRDRQNNNQQQNRTPQNNNNNNSINNDNNVRRSRFDNINDRDRDRRRQDQDRPDHHRSASINSNSDSLFNAELNKSFNRNPRAKTPVNSSPARDFVESSYVPANDFRPCYYTLQKIMEMDTEITKLHDKIHGIDKVIQNLHSERVNHQKSFNKLQHDRKVLFDNLMKRASNTRSKSSEARGDSPQPVSVGKKEKKYVPPADSRKRKQDEIYEKILNPKAAEETAETQKEKERAEKAAKALKERERLAQEERDRKKLIEERKRKKLMRQQREEEERLRLERKICQEEVIKVSKSIKKEPRDVSTEKQKSQDRQKSVDRNKSIERQKPAEKSSNAEKVPASAKIFESEIMKVDNYKLKELRINIFKCQIPHNKIDEFLSKKSVELDMDQIELSPPKRPQVIERVEKPVEKEAEQIDKILPDDDDDEDEEMPDEKPKTPGSEMFDSLQQNSTEDDQYADWTGNFNSHESTIVDLQVAEGKFLLAACQDGKVLKYDINDGTLLAEFHEHKEICNAILYDGAKYVYSVSSDGFLNQINFHSFDLKSFEDYSEPLQLIEKSKTSIFVGSKSGHIYRLQNDLIDKPEVALCEIGAMVFSLKTWREGSRNVLLVSSRNQPVQVRDAEDGLLLRLINEDYPNLTIFDLLIDGGTVYCGSSLSEIHAIDFTNGALKKQYPSGKGTICLRMYKNYLIAACYDGNIYIFNTTNDEIMNICGPSTVQLLAMDLWDDKIVATTNDKTLKIIKIPF